MNKNDWGVAQVAINYDKIYKYNNDDNDNKDWVLRNCNDQWWLVHLAFEIVIIIIMIIMIIIIIIIIIIIMIIIIIILMTSSPGVRDWRSGVPIDWSPCRQRAYIFNIVMAHIVIAQMCR